MRFLVLGFACLFSAFAFAGPTFSPQLILKNQYGEVSINSPQLGSNYVANFQSATITLTAAQVIALPGTPIQLVAASSGNLIKVVAVEMLYTKGSAAFTIGSSKHLIVQYHTSATLIQQIGTTGFIDQASNKTGMLIGGGAGGVGIGGQAVEITSDDTTPVSGGTGSTVKVTVYYDILKVL